MFRKRLRGLVPLEPLTGREEPVQPNMHLLKHERHAGDLQDLRNRLGLLVPHSARFVEMDLPLKPPQNMERHMLLMDFMQLECYKNSCSSRAYYIDPYGRDRPGGAMQMMLDYRQAAYAASKQSPSKRKGKGASVTPRMQRLQEAMDKSRERREEQRQKDAQMWGEGAEEEFYSMTHADKEVPKVSPHLYQPRNPKPKSEWTTNMEAAMALSRKKDLQQVNLRRLEKHAQHGDDVRINRDLTDSDALEKFVSKMREKDERIAKFLKSKVKYQ